MLMAPPPEEAQAPPPTEEAPPSPEAAVAPPAVETTPPTTTVPQPDKGWDDSGESAGNGNRAQLRNTLASDAASNRAELRQMLDEVPERAKDALRRALAVSEDGYEEAIEALD